MWCFSDFPAPRDNRGACHVRNIKLIKGLHATYYFMLQDGHLYLCEVLRHTWQVVLEACFSLIFPLNVRELSRIYYHFYQKTWVLVIPGLLFSHFARQNMASSSGSRDEEKTKGLLVKLAQKYNHYLRTNPVLTKSITRCVKFYTVSCIAQVLILPFSLQRRFMVPSPGSKCCA